MHKLDERALFDGAEALSKVVIAAQPIAQGHVSDADRLSFVGGDWPAGPGVDFQSASGFAPHHEIGRTGVSGGHARVGVHV